MSEILPTWITSLRPSTRILAEVRPMPTAEQASRARLRDTLLIGLGPVGREVLSQVAMNLYSRFQGNWPTNIRLLQIDVQLISGNGGSGSTVNASQLQPPAGLSASQWVLLRPNADEVRRSIHAGGLQHWNWYEASGQPIDRASGRMALFYDLKDGCDHSRIWTEISEGLNGLESPQLRVIGSTFDDVSSGMLVDINHLVHLILGREEDVQLWLAGPLGREWSEHINQRGRKFRLDEQFVATLATMRELERFQRNAPVSFNYVSAHNLQEQLRRVTRSAVVQTVILFEGNAQNVPEEDVFATMADCLSTFVNEEANTQLLKALKNKRDKVGAMANRDGIGSVAAMGSFSLRTLGRSLDEALAWRLIYDSLFEVGIGLVPVSAIERTSGAYLPLKDLAAETGQTGKASQQRRMEIEDLVTRLVLKKMDMPAFYEHLRIRLEEMLNGQTSAGISLKARSQGIDLCLAYLDTLRTNLRRNGITAPIQALVELYDSLNGWRNWLHDAAEQNCRARLESAQQRLKQLKNQPSRAWAGLNASLEYDHYFTHLRPWLNEPPAAGCDTLSRFAVRFGWRLHYDMVPGRWHLKFLIPPPGFAYEPGHDLDCYTMPQEPNMFLDSLFALALPMATAPAELSSNDILDLIKRPGWIRQAEVRLKYNEMSASERTGGGISKVGLLTSGSPTVRDRLAAFIENNTEYPIAGLQICETTDQTALTLIRLDTWLPTRDVNLYADSFWQSHPVGSQYYVWRGEQVAAAIEGERRLSHKFVAQLGQDEELAHAFALGFIYNIFESDGDYVFLLEGGKISFEHGSPGKVFETLLNPDTSPAALKLNRDRVLKSWGQAIKAERERLQAQKKRLNFLRSFQQVDLLDLKNSEEEADRNLAIYLNGVIAQEQHN